MTQTKNASQGLIRATKMTTPSRRQLRVLTFRVTFTFMGYLQNSSLKLRGWGKKIKARREKILLTQQTPVKMSSYKNPFKRGSYSPNSESDGCSWNCKKKSEVDDSHKNCQGQSYKSYKDESLYDTKSTVSSSSSDYGFGLWVQGSAKK